MIFRGKRITFTPSPRFKLKPHFKKKIKFYDILFENRKIIMKYIKNYNDLRRNYNRYLRPRYLLPSGYKLDYDHKKLIGVLRIPGWKKKTRKFNFFLNQNYNDKKFYDFWNLESSYLKYVYSRVNRMHPYRQIYNLAYRTLLVFPYSLTIKPYTIIIKNFNYNGFFLVIEWANKWNQLTIVSKVIDKKIRNREDFSDSVLFDFSKKTNQSKNNNILYNLLFLGLRYSIKFKNNCLAYKNHYHNYMEVILSSKKIKFLLWRRENWLWRLRANWKFLRLHRYTYTNRFKILLLKSFQKKILSLNYYEKLPLEVFIERFTKNLINELLDDKSINLFNVYKKSKFRFINIYQDKHLFFKSRDEYLKQFTLNYGTFFSRLYYIYFFWMLFFFNNIYKYFTKIMFNLWIRFFYFMHNINNLGNFFTLNLLKKNNMNYNIFFNYEEFFLFNVYKLVYSNIYSSHLSRYFLDLKNIYKLFIFDYKKLYLIPKSSNSLFFIYFNNFKSINFNGIYNYYLKTQRQDINYFIGSILDYHEVNNYTFFVNFRDYYLQTFRFLIETPLGVLRNLKENDNRANFDKIYLFIHNIRKEELRYSNFELNIFEDKRMYFL